MKIKIGDGREMEAVDGLTIVHIPSEMRPNTSEARPQEDGQMHTPVASSWMPGGLTYPTRVPGCYWIPKRKVMA